MPIDFISKLNEAINLFDLKGVHPAANIPPMMTEIEYNELLDDVKEKGFLHPIRITTDKMLIDGRNRICVSIDSGLDVSIEIYDPVDPISYVLSENKRRNLTTGQRAAMGVDAEALYAEEAKQKQVEAGGDKKSEEYKKTLVANLPQLETAPKTRDKAAKAAGTSPRSVSTFKEIAKEDPILADEVRAGNKSLNAASTEIKKKKEIANVSKFNETNDNIEWAPYSWNPVTGCKYGCPYCYAKDIAMRFTGHFNPEFHENRLLAPENTKPKVGQYNNVFVCSMADLFGEWVPAEWIQKILDTVEKNQQWNFLFLTKNPKRYIDFQFPTNCWIGATADTQARFDEAINVFNNLFTCGLLPTVSFISIEPMEEELNIIKNVDKQLVDILNWIIIGGRSKSSKMTASQPKWEWVEKVLMDARANKIPVYFKPNLTVRPMEFPEYYEN